MKRNAGFTILELLAVTVILAVLATLVLAGVQQWQAKANQARCMANMKAIGAGLFAAAAENNGSVMPRVTAVNSPWPQMIDTYVGGKNLNNGLLYSPVWACPENKERVKFFKKYGHMDATSTGYPINRHLIVSSGTNYVQGVAMASIVRPSQKVYVIESCRGDTGAFGPATAMYYPPYAYKGWMKQVHNSGNTVLFCDGHIESVGPTHELCSEVVNISNLWWSPEK